MKFLTRSFSKANLLFLSVSIVKSLARLYGKVLEEEYHETHTVRANRRLFDGDHDVISVWSEVMYDLPDGSFEQELVERVLGLWKYFTTIKELPLIIIRIDTFDTWKKVLSRIPAVEAKHIDKLLTVDAMKLFSIILGMMSIVFALNKEDRKKLAEILFGSMGIREILEKNPLMAIAVIATAGYSYKKKQMELDKDTELKPAV